MYINWHTATLLCFFGKYLTEDLNNFDPKMEQSLKTQNPSGSNKFLFDFIFIK